MEAGTRCWSGKCGLGEVDPSGIQVDPSGNENEIWKEVKKQNPLEMSLKLNSKRCEETYY